MEPPKASERLESPINIKILALIIGVAIAFHFSVSSLGEVIADEIISIVSFVNPLAVAIAGFFIAKRYSGTHVFGKAYSALAFAYLSVFFAEVTYLIYDLILNLDPYPSIADVFFFALYPLTLTHLILNIRFFNAKTNVFTKIWMVAIPIGLLSLYGFSAIEELGDANFDFYYGMIFVAGASVTLVFAILGAKVFREGVLGVAWLLLVIGILGLTIGDVWYYNLEIFGEYDLQHPVNLFWYTGYWLIVYALIKHKTII